MENRIEVKEGDIVRFPVGFSLALRKVRKDENGELYIRELMNTHLESKRYIYRSIEGFKWDSSLCKEQGFRLANEKEKASNFWDDHHVIYFGTNLNTAGHYLWEISGDRMNESTLLKLGKLPFNPENMPCGGTVMEGVVKYYYKHGWSIVAISGSPRDRRPGSKSVFFVKENIDYLTFLTRLYEIPAAMKIINSFIFPVYWSEHPTVCTCNVSITNAFHKGKCIKCQKTVYHER